MLDIQTYITLAVTTALLFYINIAKNLEKENENLRVKLKVKEALAEANKTRATEFNNSMVEIEKDYNETVTTFRNTPVGGSIDFGLRE